MKRLLFYRTKRITEFSGFNKFKEIVTLIRSSPQRFTSFSTLCNENQAEWQTIPLFYQTRWGSSYKMLQRGLQLKNIVNLWCSENDIDKITEEEWIELQNLNLCLKPFADLSSFVQGQNYPTMWMVLAIYNKLFDSLDEAMAEYPNNAALSKAFAKLKKYYELTNNCPANFISTVLCTKYKLNYFIENQFEEELPEIKQLLHFISF